MAKAPRYAAKTMLFRCYVIVLQCDALEGRCWCDATAALGGDGALSKPCYLCQLTRLLSNSESLEITLTTDARKKLSAAGICASEWLPVQEALAVEVWAALPAKARREIIETLLAS